MPRQLRIEYPGAMYHVMICGNHRHKLIGHVLSGRYKAQLVEGSGNGYLRTACDYVHLNPVRAGLLKPEERLLGYPWSSFGYYLATPEHRPRWMRVDRLLGEHGLPGDTGAARQEFERRIETRRLEPGDEEALASGHAQERQFPPAKQAQASIPLSAITVSPRFMNDHRKYRGLTPWEDLFGHAR